MEITKDETQELIDEKLKQIETSFGRQAKLMVKEIIILVNNLSSGQTTRYIPLPMWNDYHPHPTVSAMRNYITHAKQNGFDKVYFKKGKNNYIDELEFFKWLRSGNNDRK